jgi:hypothetical protein
MNGMKFHTPFFSMQDNRLFSLEILPLALKILHLIQHVDIVSVILDIRGLFWHKHGQL